MIGYWTLKIQKQAQHIVFEESFGLYAGLIPNLRPICEAPNFSTITPYLSFLLGPEVLAAGLAPSMARHLFDEKPASHPGETFQLTTLLLRERHISYCCAINYLKVGLQYSSTTLFDSSVKSL